MSSQETPVRFTANGNRAVAAILATPQAATDCAVLLCHGFLTNKNSTTNKTLTRSLTEEGLATLRFDFFGHGESDGPLEAITVSAAVNQALAALEWLAVNGYKRIGLIGSSFGGLVSILTAAKKSDLACLGLKCPVADFAEVLRLEFGEAGMAHWKAHHEIPDVTGGPKPVRMDYALYENSLAHDGYEAAAAIKIPTLIVQGEKDELVPLHQSSRLMGALQGKRQLEILPGADHGFTKGEDFKKMATLLSDWMVKHLT
jgi:pimeloyl-ACP methyl ester carboxylesterase